MASKKDAARAAVLAKYRETISHDKLKDTRVDLKGDNSFEVISFGSSILDQVVGAGGVPRGRVTEIYGSESVGKTTLATSICTSAQRLNPNAFCLYIDFEHAFAPDYAQQGIGLNLSMDHFDLHQPNYFEQGAALIDVALKTIQPDVIVLDSIAAMTPKKEFEAEPDTDPGKFMGLKARLLSSWMQKVVKAIDEANTALILVNQVRARIKTGPYDFGPDEDTTGGKAIKFYASLRIHLKPGATEYANLYNPMLGKKEKTAISNFVRGQVVKNKIGGWNRRQGEFCIRYGEGIDNVRSIIDVAMAHNIIKKGGAWYEYVGATEETSFKRNGVELVREYLIQNPSVFAELGEKVRDVLEHYTIKRADTTFEDSELERHELIEDGERLSFNELPSDDSDDFTPEELMPGDEDDDGVIGTKVDLTSVMDETPKVSKIAAVSDDDISVDDLLSADELREAIGA